jgi:hypothetical protein
MVLSKKINNMEKKFEWTDEKIVEFVNYTLNHSSAFTGRYQDLEDFKKLHTKSKEWEIIRFHYLSPDNCNHVYLKGNGEYCYGSGEYGGSLESLTRYGSSWGIHTVKRLSDGEELKVGDDTQHGKIEGFEIYDQFLRVLYKAKGDWQFLNSVLKKKQPLFQTSDGQDVFIGSEVYRVVIHPSCTLHDRVKKIKIQETPQAPQEGRVYFHSFDKAVEYVAENIPVLSLNEIKDHSPSWDGRLKFIAIQKLKSK